MLLEMPFLAAHNPNIDWKNDTITGDVLASTKDAHLWTETCQHQYTIKLVTEQPEEQNPCHSDAPSNEEIIQTQPITCRRITHATELAIQASKKEKILWSKHVPTEYHSYNKVFSEEQAMRFPASRPWDHAIELLPDASHALDCKVYLLTPKEQEALNQFLEEHLKKGYICRSNSPYASPFFFVKKKDGKLRPVQDYRRLNEWTVRNKYPLPLIKELIQKLAKKQWFTKFDV